MSNYRHLMSSALRQHPTLYSEPLDVTVEMLGSGGNYHWDKEGLLQPSYPDSNDDTRMHYADLDQDQARIDEDRTESIECLASLIGSRQLALSAERQRRRLLDENMEVVLNGNPTATYFRKTFEFGSSIRNLVVANTRLNVDTRFLYFPDNIDPQWGRVVQEFHDWLLLRMNNQFGVSISGSIEHWPQNAQVQAQKVQLARERLHPLLNNGEEYAKYIERSNDMASRLIDEMLSEESELQPGVQKTRPAGRRIGR